MSRKQHVSRDLTPGLRGRTLAILFVMFVLLPLSSASAAPLNILFFGNSFLEGEGGSRTVPNLVAAIATAAGHATPNAVAVNVDAADLAFHAANTTFVIDLWAPPGENWDFVVMQDYSTLPTSIGDVSAHRAAAVAIYQAAAAHSPGVVPVMFETWARGPANEFYDPPTPVFPGGPAQMQQELREAYQFSAADINAVAGSNIARIASVGDAFESTGFAAGLYDEEQYHASLVGTLTAALVTYSSIYNDPYVMNINLSGLLAELELTEADLALATGGWAQVPEPSSWVLLATALAALGWIRRRQR